MFVMTAHAGAPMTFVGVQPAAEPDLEHHDVAAAALKPEHGRRRHELKLRRLVVHGRNARLQRLARGSKLPRPGSAGR